MPELALPPLPEWGNFYVVTGSAAAALTGLMFVVIALRRDVIIAAGARAVSAFGTPTVLHFCGVLLIAGIMSIPRHSVTTLALSAGSIGIAGVTLTTRVVVQTRRQSSYAPVLTDWIWHVVFPLVAYGTVAAAAAVLPRGLSVGLVMVAVASLLLLFVGIHNAWDAALWIAVKKPGEHS